MTLIPRIPEWLSVLDLLLIALLALAVFALWRKVIRWKRDAPVDSSTRAEVHRLTGRMLSFERDIGDIRELVTRMEQSAIQRDKERTETQGALLTAATAQLDTMARTLSLAKKIDRQQRYINARMEERPCMTNEKANGDEESCPAGHDIDMTAPDEEPEIRLPPGFGDDPEPDGEKG